MKFNFEISIGNLISLAIPALTFFWYRSGRLWNIYFSIYDKSIKQFKSKPLNKDAWAAIFEPEINSLSTNIFGAVFSFETSYLRHLIEDYWKTHLCKLKNVSGTNSIALTDGRYFEESHEFTVNDDELYVRNSLRKAIGSKFLFGGILLPAASLLWFVRTFRSRGYTYIRSYEIRKCEDS